MGRTSISDTRVIEKLARGSERLVGKRHGYLTEELDREVVISILLCLQSNGEAHNGLGVIMRKEGMSVSAEERYRDASRLMPNSAEPLYNLAVLYLVRASQAWQPACASTYSSGFMHPAESFDNLAIEYLVCASKASQPTRMRMSSNGSMHSAE